MPQEPAPNPLKLEKIFDEPDASQKEERATELGLGISRSMARDLVRGQADLEFERGLRNPG